MKHKIMKIILLVMIISTTFFLSACTNNEKSSVQEAITDDSKEIVSEGKNTTEDTNSPDEENDSSNKVFDTSQAMTTEEGCYDSDGGSFDKIKGFILDINKNKFVDECVNSFSVKEYYCGITGFKSDKIINCKFKCVDGVCVEGESDKNCIDSDFYDEFTKGTVTYKGETKLDYCETDKVLIEQVCSNVDIATTKDIVCDGGCSDGRCLKVDIVEQDSDCTDPDQGPDAAFTKTTVIDKKGSWTDECLNIYEVKEYYCNNYGFHTDKNIKCDNGCEDGVCKQ